jgi:hypothetical protein
MDTNENVVGVTEDEGGSGKISAEVLNEFSSDLEQINSEEGCKIRQQQRTALESRFCKWPGQSPDGRKWDEVYKRQDLKKKVFPFDGAPDTRNRLADFAVNFRAGIQFMSVLRAAGLPDVQGVEGQDTAKAAKVKLLLRHVIRNLWGPHFLRQVMLSAQYIEGNEPGACIVLSRWRRESGLQNERVTLEDVAGRLLEAAQGQTEGQAQGQPQPEGTQGTETIDGATLETVAAAMELLQTPSRAREAADLLVSLFPEVKPARARRMVRELQQDGKTDFPKTVERIVNQPDIQTLKLFEDVFLNVYATDLDNCRAHIPEFLTPVQLRERGVSSGYDQKVIDELLGEGTFANSKSGCIGQTKIFEAERMSVINRKGESFDPYKGLVELVSTIYKASNEDGLPMWYIVTWCPSLNKAVTERQPLYAHNRFPGVFMSREVLTKYLMDSRSSSEIAMPDQEMLKMFTDLAGAAGQLKSLPPMTAPLSRPDTYETGIKPLGFIKEKRKGDVSPMPMGEYSRENVDVQEMIYERACSYFGIPHAKVPPVITDLNQQVATLLFTAGWAQVLNLTVKLCQEHMTDDEIVRLTGPNGAPIAESMDEIRGGWNVVLSYNPADMNPETVERKLKMINEFALRWDTLSTADRAKLTQAGFYLIDPALADGVLIPEEMASGKEVEDEQRLFTMIVAAGVEPARVTEGRNFKLRLDWLMNQMQQNPEPVQKAPETNRMILEAHIKHYQQMVTQQQNVQIGREGSARILG